MAGTEDNPIGSPATSPGYAVQLAGLAQARGTEGLAGFDDTAVVAKAAESDAPASEAADTAATDPVATSPFRLVIHFILPETPEQTGPRGPEPIRGTKHDDVLFGDDGVDHFDANAGGNDVLHGRGGNDVYWLGFRTGHDRIDESYTKREDRGDPGDVIRLKKGHSKDDVRLEIEPIGSSHLGAHLRVSLLDASGTMTDSYTVVNHFRSHTYRVERVESADGKLLFDLTDKHTLRIRGGPGNDALHGYSRCGDHFDADAGGDDVLVSRGSENVYWLGLGTGRDIIRSASGVVRLERGFTTDNVRLVAEKRDLHVMLVDARGVETDRYTVLDHFRSPYRSAIDRVELSTGDPVFGEADFFAAWHKALAEDGYQPDPVPEENGITRVQTEDGGRWYGSSRFHDNFAVGTHETDWFRGNVGNDIYWLGTDTGHDLIWEPSSHTYQGDPHDAIIVKKGISAPKQGLAMDPERAALAWGSEPTVRVHRDGNGRDLVVDVIEKLPEGEHKVLSSLSVKGFFPARRIEHIVFAEDPSASLSLKDLLTARIIGGPEDDTLKGDSGPNVFDSFGGGNDRLYGYRGNDVYYLGLRTGIDTIFEHRYPRGGSRSPLGDSGDRVVVKEGIHVPDIDQISRPASDDVPTLRIRRSNNGNDLLVEVYRGTVEVSSLVVDDFYLRESARIESITDSTGATIMDEEDLLTAKITGTPSDEHLHGESNFADHFDAHAGGSDYLYGYGGSDVYWLGVDTGNDVIVEWYENTGRDDIDKIRVKEDASRYTLSWHRSNDGNDLHVVLLDDDGESISSLVVEQQFSGGFGNAEVEQIVDHQGRTVFSSESGVARIIGTPGNDHLHGKPHLDDHFDPSAGGNDDLYGYGGNDVYWIGTGTGKDKIHEYVRYGDDDQGDVIRISRSGSDTFGRADINLRRDGDDLVVAITDNSGDVLASLTAVKHFLVSSCGQIERVEFDGRVLLSSEYTDYINAVAEFNAGTSRFATLSALHDSYWDPLDSLVAPSV